MTVYNELNGTTLISNATDREGNPITVYRINGSIISWAGLESVPIVAGELTAYVSENGTVTVEPTDDTNSPADAATTVFGTFTYVLWDGITEGATETCTVSLKGAASPGGSSPYILTGMVFTLDPDAGVTGSSPVTAWADQIGAKSFIFSGSPTIGTPPGGTATNTIVFPVDTYSQVSNMTNMPTGGADFTMMMAWEPATGGYCGFGFGTEAYDQAAVLAVDVGGELAFDFYGHRELLGVNAYTRWNIITGRLASGVLTVWVGEALIYQGAVTTVPGASFINLFRTFSGAFAVTGECGDIIVYGRALTDAEVLANVATANARFIGDTTVAAMGTPAGSNVAGASFTVGGTVPENYGYVRWAVKAGTGAMTEQEIIDGTGALDSGVFPVNNVSSWSANIAGAAASTTYRCHAIFYDLVGSKTTVVNSADIVTLSADSTAPVLTSPDGDAGTASTSATVSATTDETNGDAIWGVYLATATKPTRTQLRNSTDGDGTDLIATGTVSPVSSTSLSDTAAALTPNTTYQVAWQQDDAAGNQSTVEESASWSTAASPTTNPDRVDGLANGSEPVGRTSVNSLKTVGQLPAGASLGTGVITITQNNVTLEDFDLSGYSLQIGNRTGTIIRQNLFDAAGSARISGSHFIVMGAGANNTTIDYNDVDGGEFISGIGSLILQQKSSNTAGASTSTGVIIERNKIYNMSNDGAHTAGGGVIVRWNWFGLPSATPAPLEFYSGTPGDYTTGDCVAWERNPGGGEWYVLQCTVASPTLHPAKDGNANWTRRGEHTDYINPRASIGAGTTIQYNFIKDNWIQAMLDGETVSIADCNNAMRFVRNSGDLAPFNSCVVQGNKNTRYLNTPSFPFQIGTGSGMVGPVDFIDNRIGVKSGGGWYTGNTSIWGTFSGNTNSTTGAPLSQP